MRSGLTRSRVLLAVPALALLLVFFVVPLGHLLVTSLERFSYTGGDGGFTFANYINFFSDTYYLQVILRTFYYSLIVSVLCLILGFPIALLLARTQSPRLKALLLFGVIAPLLVSVVVRTFGWLIVLGEFGVLNQTLKAIGITGAFVNRTHLFNGGAVVLGLVHVLLPIMVLSIYAALQKQSPRLVDAARGLGAGPFRAFLHVTLPLSLPGIAAGMTTVLALAGGSYIAPAVLGGSKVIVMSILAYQQTFGLANWQFGSAISVVLLLGTLLGAGLLQRFLQKRFSRSFD